MAQVSVIIPTYNRAQYLAQAVQSALDQDLADLEVVVVDDGSTDDTRAVVSQFTDARVRYVYQENQGATVAFNRGLAESTGDYVSILGSDDWYLPNGLMPLLREMEDRAHLGAVSGGFIYVNEAGEVVRESCPWSSFPRLDTRTWLFWCPSILQASLIRRRWIDAIGGFDPAVKCVQDWDFGLRLAYAGCQMAWLERPVFNYRLHRNQISRDASAIRRDYQTVLDNFFTRKDLPFDLETARAPAYAHAYVKGAIRAFEAGQWEDGNSDLDRAIQIDPHLLDRRGQRVFDLLVGWANDTLTVEPVRFIDGAFEHLPDSAEALKRRRRAALAALDMEAFFAAHERGDVPGVRRAFVQGVARDPSWLLNRGVISVILEAAFGRGFMGLSRRLAHLTSRSG